MVVIVVVVGGAQDWEKERLWGGWKDDLYIHTCVGVGVACGRGMRLRPQHGVACYEVDDKWTEDLYFATLMMSVMLIKCRVCCFCNAYLLQLMRFFVQTFKERSKCCDWFVYVAMTRPFFAAWVIIVFTCLWAECPCWSLANSTLMPQHSSIWL